MSLQDNFRRVFTALNQADVRYLLVGGIAVAAHGYPRATADIDISLALDRENALRAIHALSEIGYRPVAPVAATDFADPAIRRRWVEEKGMLAFPMGTGNPLDMPVDLLADENFPFAAAYESARKTEIMPGLTIPVVPFAVLLEMKRGAGRPRDLEDVRELLARNPPPPPPGGPDL